MTDPLVGTWQTGNVMEAEWGSRLHPHRRSEREGPTHPLCIGTYRFVVTADTLRLNVVKQSSASSDGPYGTALFASFPLTKVGGPPTR
jgi:hypothetical protein